jgi:hypothetical protein
MRDFKDLPRRPTHPLAWVLISLYLIACPVLAQSLEVIDLKYRTAAEVTPVHGETAQHATEYDQDADNEIHRLGCLGLYAASAATGEN